MIYLLSSSPKTISAYFSARGIPYTLISKEGFGVFMQEYIPQAGDWGLVYDFGKIIPEDFLQTLFLLNIHFSLLPRHRGAVPVEAALLAGDQITGIAVQKMDKKMDAGDILLTREVEIVEGETAGELQARMDALLPEVLAVFVDTPKEQWTFSTQVGEPTFCYMKWLNRENGKLDFAQLTAEEIIRRIRAYNPEPLAWTIMENRGKRVEVNILKAEMLEELELEPGKLQFVKKRGLAVGTKKGTVLITKLIVAGSKPLTGGDIVSLKGSLTY